MGSSPAVAILYVHQGMVADRQCTSTAARQQLPKLRQRACLCSSVQRVHVLPALATQHHCARVLLPVPRAGSAACWGGRWRWWHLHTLMSDPGMTGCTASESTSSQEFPPNPKNRIRSMQCPADERRLRDCVLTWPRSWVTFAINFPLQFWSDVQYY
jgi:hypothetical protein